MEDKTEEETTTKRNIVKICFTSCQQSAGQNFDRHSRTDKTSEQSNSSDQQYKCEACGVFVTGLQKYKDHRFRHIYGIFRRDRWNQSTRKRPQKKKRTADYNIKPNDVALKSPRIKKTQNKRKETDLKRCYVCCHNFPLQELDTHMHSLFHHQAIEKLKGSEQVHKCWACDVSMIGMQQYKKHINTVYHKYMMVILNRKTNVEKSTVDYNIDDELKAACARRDQETFQKSRKRLNSDFTNDEMPLSCYFSSWEEQPNSSKSSPNQKRRREGVFDQKSTDPGVKTDNIESELSVKSCTKKKVRQTCKSSNNEEIDQQPETRKKNKRKEKLAKGTTSKKSMNAHSPEESKAETCSSDVTPALRNKRTKINAKKSKLQQKPDIPGEDNKGPKASVVSLEAKEQKAEKIGGLDSKTSATSNDLQIQKVQPNTEHVKLVSAENLQSVPSNLQKPRNRKRNISNISPENPKTIDTSRQENVTKLMTLCNREENLRGSLENVGEQLFQAYSTLQSTYTKVQRLLAVKQQVTSEMASLRAKRIKILQDMKDPCQSRTSESCEDLT